MFPGELAEVFSDSVYREAAGVLDMISQSPEDRQFYEARMKFLHDEEARLLAARMEGLEKGREEGAALGTLCGKIQLLQSFLGDSETPTSELLLRRFEDLSLELSALQKRFRARGG